MDVLPESNEGYTGVQYWDQRYTKESNGTEYDWFKKYSEIQHILTKFIKKSDRIIMLGCGNSTLSAEMYDDGFHQITNIDYSNVCIENMKIMNISRPEMKWIVGDITKELPFEVDSFDIAIDKGTMDALMALGPDDDVWAPPKHIIETVEAELTEAIRLIGDKGKFIYITYAGPIFRKPRLNRSGWKLEIIEIGDAFFYYCYILTKDNSQSI